MLKWVTRRLKTPTSKPRRKQRERFFHEARRLTAELLVVPLPSCCCPIVTPKSKSISLNQRGKPCFDWNPTHPCWLEWFRGLTPAIRSAWTPCHESFITYGREWIISGTQVLSQRGSDLTRSIYTLSLWIRPRECHTAAQSTLLLLHPLSSHPSVCTIITPFRELSATHGDIKKTKRRRLWWHTGRVHHVRC